jgi:hypothetical protein
MLNTLRTQLLPNASLIAVALIVSTGSALAADSISNWDASNGLPDSSWATAGSSFTSAPDKLTISTDTPSANTYFIENKSNNPSFSTTAGLSIEARVRYVSGSQLNDARDSIVFAVTQGNNWGNGLFIGNGRIFMLADNMVRGATANVDTQGFHTYRIDVGASDSASPTNFNIYYDGVLKLSGSTYNSAPANGTDQSVYWGEGSMLANGTSEWQFVRNTAPVPEPETWAMLLAGLGLTGALARRKQS